MQRTNPAAGGLSTDLRLLRANLFLSTAVAFTGIAVPTAVSFVLRTLMDITSLQAFAAGAALCSTSLGTTFTVLSTSGLTESRLGVVLSSAAMIDDVVGLVMVQVISSLGRASVKFDPVTVIRPVFVSIAFAVVVPALCVWVVRLLVLRAFAARNVSEQSGDRMSWLNTANARFIMHTLFLVGMVTASTYAGTSNLFVAYLAGTVVTWTDSLLLDRLHKMQQSDASTETSPTTTEKERSAEDPIAALEDHHTDEIRSDPQQEQPKPFGSGSTLDDTIPKHNNTKSLAGSVIYETSYGPTVNTILKPFFFASIGFSIPITQMFSGSIVWRGFVYAALMTLAKLICGAWLIRLPGLPLPNKTMLKNLPPSLSTCWPWELSSSKKATQQGRATPIGCVNRAASAASPQAVRPCVPTEKAAASSRPLSFYPAAILGAAMVARGEIGFLVSSVAQSSGVYTSELFLVVTWAIFICTFLGPVTVGLLVRRVRTLEIAEREKETGRPDPLGVWGIKGSIP